MSAHEEAPKNNQRRGTSLDSILPEPDFGNRHSIVIDAPAQLVWEAAESYRADRSWIIRVLFRLRGLPVPKTLRQSMSGMGFNVLGERPNEEVVVGIAGKFWTLNEAANLIPLTDARSFIDFKQPGTAKAAANVRVERLSAARTLLSTETRVGCADSAAYRNFALYWAMIKPWSGIIRRSILQGIKRQMSTADLRRSK
jgi:hypothetical protein